MELLFESDSARPSHSVADESPATHSAELLHLKFELILNLGYCDLLFGMLYSPFSCKTSAARLTISYRQLLTKIYKSGSCLTCIFLDVGKRWQQTCASK